MFKYCPQCKTELVPGKEDEHSPERLMCPKCHYVHYNNPRPGAGALVIKDGKILLTQRGREPQKGFWDFPGGYMDTFEAPEECAIREIKEETGYTVKLERIFGLYFEKETYEPWTVLCIYYLASIIEGSSSHPPDILELGWFAPHELPPNLAFTHTIKCLNDWKKYIKK
jgi:ADP-ribose pyrophosphatase YjhB (NUDIX family)